MHIGSGTHRRCHFCKLLWHQYRQQSDCRYNTPIPRLTDAQTNCVVIATPEVMYDERLKNLDEFYNEAGTICRGYRLRQGNMFSVTADAFASSPTSLTVGTALGIGSNGKIATSVGNSKTTLGYLRAIETTSRYTYYVIEVA